MMIRALILSNNCENKQVCEKIADCFLAVPRKMWCGHGVKLIKNAKNGEYNALRPERLLLPEMLFRLTDSESKIVFLISIIFYTALCILAFIPTAIGLGLKKIALHNNPQSQKFSEVVEKYLISEDQEAIDGWGYDDYCKKYEKATKLLDEADKKKINLETEKNELEFESRRNYTYPENILSILWTKIQICNHEINLTQKIIESQNFYIPEYQSKIDALKPANESFNNCLKEYVHSFQTKTNT